MTEAAAAADFLRARPFHPFRTMEDKEENIGPRWTPTTSSPESSRDHHPALNGTDLYSMLGYLGNMSHPPTESPYATTKAVLLTMR